MKKDISVLQDALSEGGQVYTAPQGTPLWRRVIMGIGVSTLMFSAVAGGLPAFAQTPEQPAAEANYTLAMVTNSVDQVGYAIKAQEDGAALYGLNIVGHELETFKNNEDGTANFLVKLRMNLSEEQIVAFEKMANTCAPELAKHGCEIQVDGTAAKHIFVSKDVDSYKRVDIYAMKDGPRP